MKTVVLAALSFAIFRWAAALLLPAMALFSQQPRRPSASDDFLLVLYLIAVATALATAGFLVATALSPFWRRVALWRAVLIAGALGLVAPFASIFLTAFLTAGTAPVVLPLFHSAPWLALTLFHVLPGVVFGAVAVGIAKLWPATSPTTH